MTTIPIAGAWTFKDGNIAETFDAHVREQLPWYDLATGAVIHYVRHYLPPGGKVVDLGCATGNIGRALEPVLDQRKATVIPIDPSPEMIQVYTGPGEPRLCAAEEFDFAAEQPDVVIAFLTLMFMPIPVRAIVLERIRASLPAGGACVIFDKIAAASGYLGTVSYRLTLAAKYEAGAQPDEIIAKELSLAGVQRPLEGYETAGMTQVFQFGQFGGWVIEAGRP